MNFNTKLPKTRSQHDAIMVLVEKLTKNITLNQLKLYIKKHK